MVTPRELGSVSEGNLDANIFVRVGNATLGTSSAELDDNGDIILWADL